MGPQPLKVQPTLFWFATLLFARCSYPFGPGFEVCCLLHRNVAVVDKMAQHCITGTHSRCCRTHITTLCSTSTETNTTQDNETSLHKQVFPHFCDIQRKTALTHEIKITTHALPACLPQR
jgi:hypothetical protein